MITYRDYTLEHLVGRCAVHPKSCRAVCSVRKPQMAQGNMARKGLLRLCGSLRLLHNYACPFWDLAHRPVTFALRQRWVCIYSAKPRRVGLNWAHWLQKSLLCILGLCKLKPVHSVSFKSTKAFFTRRKDGKRLKVAQGKPKQMLRLIHNFESRQVAWGLAKDL